MNNTYNITAEYLVPNIGMAVWLVHIISQVYADAIFMVIIIMAMVTHNCQLINFRWHKTLIWWMDGTLVVLSKTMCAVKQKSHHIFYKSN